MYGGASCIVARSTKNLGGLGRGPPGLAHPMPHTSTPRDRWSRRTLAVGKVGLLARRLKAKFHYAILQSQTGPKMVADLHRDGIWPII